MLAPIPFHRNDRSCDVDGGAGAGAGAGGDDDDDGDGIADDAWHRCVGDDDDCGGNCDIDYVEMMVMVAIAMIRVFCVDASGGTGVGGVKVC